MVPAESSPLQEPELPFLRASNATRNDIQDKRRYLYSNLDTHYAKNLKHTLTIVGERECTGKNDGVETKSKG